MGECQSHSAPRPRRDRTHDPQILSRDTPRPASRGSHPGSRNLSALQPVDSKGRKIVLLVVAAWRGVRGLARLTPCRCRLILDCVVGLTPIARAELLILTSIPLHQAEAADVVFKVRTLVTSVTVRGWHHHATFTSHTLKSGRLLPLAHKAILAYAFSNRLEIASSPALRFTPVTCL
jgi:hypothetical protein